MPELLKTFFCPLSSPSALGGSWLEPGVDVRGWCSKYAAATLKALANEVQESSSMVNVEIYWQRQLVFSYIFTYLYLLHFPSLPSFLAALLGWFIASIFPQILHVPHGIPSLCSVEIFSLSPLHPFNIPYCCSSVLCLSLSLLDFKSGRLCTLFVLPLILKIFIQLTSITCCL